MTSTNGGPDDNDAAGGGLAVSETLRSHVRPGSNSLGNLVVDNSALGERARALTTSQQRQDATVEDFILAYNVMPESGHGADLTAVESEVAQTITAVEAAKGDRGTRIVDRALAVRRLTPLECERLQGFPDGYTDGQSDSVRYAQLGNAVCVNVAEWIGRKIVEVDCNIERGEV